MAWSITTYFVVPVIVVEQTGPIDAIKRSVAIMKKTWGESLAANFGIGVITFLLCIIGAIPVVAGVVALSSKMVAVGLTLIAMGVLFILVVSLISSALSSIILAALYVYAAEDKVPDQFDASLIKGAFASK